MEAAKHIGNMGERRNRTYKRQGKREEGFLPLQIYILFLKPFIKIKQKKKSRTNLYK